MDFINIERTLVVIKREFYLTVFVTPYQSGFEFCNTSSSNLNIYTFFLLVNNDFYKAIKYLNI